MNDQTGFSAIARAVIVAAGLTLILSFMQKTASVLTPVLLALFIAIILTPPLRWLQRKRVPKWLALAAIVLFLMEAGSILALVFTGELEGFREGLPSYQERLIVLTDQLGGWLENMGVSNGRDAVRNILNPATAAGLVRLGLANARDTVGLGVLITLIVIFMLLEAASFPAKLKTAFAFSDAAERCLARVLKSVNRYMMIKVLASLATALCLGVWLWVLGIDFVVLWAILAFLLNFIPFLGALLMAIPPVLLALVQVDPGTALMVALGYLVVNTGIGSILEPRIMGRGLGISTLAVFLSLLFWGWVLGTVGVFLAVPLTIAMMITMEAHPQTRPLAILLGPALMPSPTLKEERPKANRADR